MNEYDTPTWAEQQKLAFRFAPAFLRVYAKEILHMSPRWYAARRDYSIEDCEYEYYVWNSKRTAYVRENEAVYYWQAR